MDKLNKVLEDCGYTLIGWCRDYNSAEGGIVFINKHEGHHQYVTWVWTGDGFQLGHYFDNREEGQLDFIERVGKL